MRCSARSSPAPRSSTRSRACAPAARAATTTCRSTTSSSSSVTSSAERGRRRRRACRRWPTSSSSRPSRVARGRLHLRPAPVPRRTPRTFAAWARLPAAQRRRRGVHPRRPVRGLGRRRRARCPAASSRALRRRAGEAAGRAHGRASWPATATSWSAPRCCATAASPRCPTRRCSTPGASACCSRTATRCAWPTPPTRRFRAQVRSAGVARRVPGQPLDERERIARADARRQRGHQAQRGPSPTGPTSTPPRPWRGCTRPGSRDAGPRPHPPPGQRGARAGLHAPCAERLGLRHRTRAGRGAAPDARRLRARRPAVRVRLVPAGGRRCGAGARRAPLARRAIPDALWQRTLVALPLPGARADASSSTACGAWPACSSTARNSPAPAASRSTDEMAVADRRAGLPAGAASSASSSYDGFVGIVVHADEVVARREVIDEDGVVHAYDEVLAGEAMEGGPVMLSLADVRGDRATVADAAYNVVIHEFAHVLDMRDGLADGVPLLAAPRAARQWHGRADAEYDRFCERVDLRRRRPCSIPTAPKRPTSSSPSRREAFFVDAAGAAKKNSRRCTGCSRRTTGRTRRVLKPSGSGRRGRLGLRLVALLRRLDVEHATSPSSSMSTVRRPPSVRRPNSSSSASARRIVSWIRRCIGRAPISGSKPFLARCLRSLSVKVTSTFFSASWLSSCSRNLSTTRRMISSSSAREADDRVQAVAELGREQALDVGHLVALLARVGEADRRLVHRLGARVGRHDDDDVAEVGLAPVVVGQRAVVHHLQQHVEDVRVRLLDLVEQQHRVRLLA